MEWQWNFAFICGWVRVIFDEFGVLRSRNGIVYLVLLCVCLGMAEWGRRSVGGLLQIKGYSEVRYFEFLCITELVLFEGSVDGKCVLGRGDRDNYW